METGSRIERISDGLSVFCGAVNVGVVRSGSKALLIDFGDGSVVEAIDGLSPDTTLFTHHHRDQACGLVGRDLGAKVCVPAAEEQWFRDPASYWNDPKSRWHLYDFHPHRLMLTEPVRVDGAISDGETLEWGGARILALATPGHTDGSLSYIVEIDGIRVAFTGDLIYDSGRIWELWSLQKGITTSDYHGFLGARGELESSLRRVLSSKPDVLAPSHGNVMRDPPAAVDALLRRLAVCYDKYVEIASLRHYYPDMFTEESARGVGMPFGAVLNPPDFLLRDGTSWIIVSESGDAFVMDSCSRAQAPLFRQWIDEGKIASVEGLWITHYHDDHVDGIPAFQEAFDCELTAHEKVAQVIFDPLAWRLPCISEAVARVDRVVRDGDTWQWREFTMAAYHLPGQTEYGGGLLVEGRGLRMLFAGDSFTEAGIDDYCPPNRNFLGEGVGFDKCLKLVGELRPDMIFNAHVVRPFSFTDDQIEFMLANLDAREKLYGGLFPWEDANFGMDESWVRCRPYEQNASPGAELRLEVILTNHSKRDREASVRLVRPPSWGVEREDAVTGLIPAKTERGLAVGLRIPDTVSPGRCVVPVDVEWDGLRLPQFAEAVAVVGR